MRTLLATLFFLVSGATGLVYQVVWARRLELTLGASTWSLGVVLGAFMAGLGLGAWWWGRRADRPGSPARRYAVLEAGIGLWGLAAPWILMGIDAVYSGIGGAGGLFTRAALAFLALLPPTFLMGGTLPVLARGFLDDDAAARRAVGWLYGVNTLGAMLGVLLADLWLVDHLGLSLGGRLAGVTNLALAAGAWVLSDRLAPRVEASAESSPVRTPWLTPPNLVAFAVGLTGLALEVGFTRTLGMAMGSTRHAFAIVLAATLAGIGLGSLLVARSGSRDAARRATTWTVLGIGVAAGGFLWCVEPGMAVLFHLVQPRMLTYGQLVGVEFLLLAAVLLPTTIFLGATFPQVARWATTTATRGGEEIGRVLLANTFGGIVGALGAAFVLVPAIGTFRMLQVLALLALGVGSVAALGAKQRLPLVLAAIALVLVGSRAPWAPERLDLDPTRIRPQPVGRQPGSYRDIYHNGGLALVYAEEGRNAHVAVRRSGSLTQLKIGGKTDASAPNDMPTQVMLGILPFLSRPDATSALVIGVGSGATARVAAEFPSVQQVDVVEIEPRVLEAARRHFDHVNHGVLDRANVDVLIDDARSVLSTRDRRYDAIISEPSNPHIAGIANLFTLDHYQQAQERLAPRGVYAQWIQLYETDEWVLSSMLRTFLAAFPHVDAWWVDSSDLLLLGALEPPHYDPRAIESAIRGNPGLVEDLPRILHASRGTDLLGRYLADETFLEGLAAGGEILRDDLPLLATRAAQARYSGQIPAHLVRRLWFHGIDRIRSGNVARGAELTSGMQTSLLLSAARMAIDAYPELVAPLLEDIPGPEAAALRSRVASLEERQRILATAIQADPANPRLQRELAAIYLDIGDRASAQPLLDGLIRNPELHDARYFLLRCRALDPTQPGNRAELISLVRAGLGAVQPRESDMEVRRDLLQTAADVQAIDLLAAIVADNPYDEVAAVALAQAQLDAEDPASCLRTLEAISATNYMEFKEGFRLLRLEARAQLGVSTIPAEIDRLLDDFPRQAANPQVMALRDRFPGR